MIHGSCTSESRFKKLERLQIQRFKKTDESNEFKCRFCLFESASESPLNRLPESPLNRDI